MKFPLAVTILAGVATALPAAVPGHTGHTPTAATLGIQPTLRMTPRQQGGAASPQPTPAAANKQPAQGDSNKPPAQGDSNKQPAQGDATIQGVIRSTTILGPVTLPVIYQFPPVSHPQANEKPQPLPPPQTNAPPPKQLDEKKKEYPWGMSTGALMAIIWGLAGLLIAVVLLIMWCQLRLLKKKFPKPSKYREPPPSKSRVVLPPTKDDGSEAARGSKAPVSSLKDGSVAARGSKAPVSSLNPPAYTRNSLDTAPRYDDHGADELHPKHKQVMVGSAGAQGAGSRMDALRARLRAEDVPQSPDVEKPAQGTHGAWGWVSNSTPQQPVAHSSNNRDSRAEEQEPTRAADDTSWRSLDSFIRGDGPVTPPVDTAAGSLEPKPDTDASPSRNTPPAKASMFERRPWTKPKRYEAPKK